MVLPAKVNSKDVHTTVVGPVISEGDNEFDSDLSGGIDYLVKLGDVDGRSAIGPPLENSIGRTRSLATILR